MGFSSPTWALDCLANLILWVYPFKQNLTGFGSFLEIFFFFKFCFSACVLKKKKKHLFSLLCLCISKFLTLYFISLRYTLVFQIEFLKSLASRISLMRSQRRKKVGPKKLLILRSMMPYSRGLTCTSFFSLLPSS